MKSDEINLEADFATFKSQIVTKFGAQYYAQAELFFGRAMAEAKLGLLQSAIADGKFALELSNYSNDKAGIEYLIGFLSKMHCNIGKISKSYAYYELGLKLLDPKARDYEESKEMYRRLKENIDGESLKGTRENDTDK